MKVLLVVPALAAGCLAQTVFTVNSAGGAQFTAIQPAITAASPGDRIEVQGAGPYGAFVVDRGVEVESLTGAISGTIEVVGVPAGQRARVSGFVVDQGSNRYVSVRNCAGTVLLANVAYTGSSVTNIGPRPGLEVLGASAVMVAHCDFRGHESVAGGTAGVRVDGSQVVFVAGSALGGFDFGGTSHGGSGNAGMEVVSGHVVLRGTTLRGGPAEPGAGVFMIGGDGGDAVDVIGGTALVLGQCQLRGAAGGSGVWANGQHGQAARGNVRFTADTFVLGPTVSTTQIADRPVVTSPGGVLVGTTLQLTVHGAPNQPVWLGLDLDFGYLPLPALDGALVLSANAVLGPAVVRDAQGAGSHPLPIPNVAALRHLDVFAQGVALVGGALVLSAPTASHTL